MRTASTDVHSSVTVHGFTLVELLVVIGVLGILLGLLLPAVQAARESARRAACGNHTRQLGIGLHGYHYAHNAFPVGCTEHRAYVRGGRQLAWSARLLPFIEQKAVHELIDFEKGFDAHENAAAAATAIAVYLCPSNFRASELIDGRAACDYGGIFGERLVTNRRFPNGTMLYDHPIAISDISDGTSTTLIVAEDCNSPDMQWINGLNVFEQMYPINQAPAGENEICSRHVGGGANALFCDGSVRFLSETISREVLAALCTRAGGEYVNGP